MFLKATPGCIVGLALGWSGEAQDAPPCIVGGVPSDGNDNQSIPALHVSDLILDSIEYGLFRSRRYADTGINNFHHCLGCAVRASHKRREKNAGRDGQYEAEWVHRAHF